MTVRILLRPNLHLNVSLAIELNRLVERQIWVDGRRIQVERNGSKSARLRKISFIIGKLVLFLCKLWTCENDGLETSNAIRRVERHFKLLLFLASNSDDLWSYLECRVFRFFRLDRSEVELEWELLFVKAPVFDNF